MPTHVERPKCELRVRELADYMAASQQGKRSVLRGIKYRSLARTLQHKEARITIATWLREGEGDTGSLAGKADWFRARMTTTDYEAAQNKYNADYIEAFVKACQTLSIPKCEMVAPPAKQSRLLNGVSIVYNPDLVTRRVTRANTVKTGCIFLRYSKTSALDPVAAAHQSAFAFKYQSDMPLEETSKPEKAMCITVDVHSGTAVPAPGNSVYLFNEMEAACEMIAAQWPTLTPPPNAIL